MIGSRAYFLHAVLHDWPYEASKRLLENTRDAMKKGYSKLFIYDIVLPPTGASISQATMDVNMMQLLSASERTQAEWEKLLDDSGFDIIKFWPDPQQYEMVIEAEVRTGENGHAETNGRVHTNGSARTNGH